MYIVTVEVLVKARWIRSDKYEASSYDVMYKVGRLIEASMTNGESIRIEISPKVA